MQSTGFGLVRSQTSLANLDKLAEYQTAASRPSRLSQASYASSVTPSASPTASFSGSEKSSHVTSSPTYSPTAQIKTDPFETEFAAGHWHNVRGMLRGADYESVLKTAHIPDPKYADFRTHSGAPLTVTANVLERAALVSQVPDDVLKYAINAYQKCGQHIASSNLIISRLISGHISPSKMALIAQAMLDQQYPHTEFEQVLAKERAIKPQRQELEAIRRQMDDIRAHLIEHDPRARNMRESLERVKAERDRIDSDVKTQKSHAWNSTPRNRYTTRGSDGNFYTVEEYLVTPALSRLLFEQSSRLEEPTRSFEAVENSYDNFCRNSVVYWSLADGPDPLAKERAQWKGLMQKSIEIRTYIERSSEASRYVAAVRVPPLHLAMLAGNQALVDRVYEDLPKAADVKSRDGETASQMATRLGAAVTGPSS